MPRSIDEAFALLLESITASEHETARALQHRNSIDLCLRNRMGMSYSFRSGSFGNGTNITRHSDVDLFAVLPSYAIDGNSLSTLRQLRQHLATRFPLTHVRIRQPAVRLAFGSGDQDKFEIVPAKLLSVEEHDWRVFNIPDRHGGWMISSPMSHNAYVRGQDARLGGKLKPLVRLLKLWKYENNIQLSSFYLELRAAQYASKEHNIIYPIDLINIWYMMEKQGLRAIRDPMDIAGYIYAGTDFQRESAIQRIINARVRAQRAMRCAENGYTRQAFLIWKTIFGGKFPSFY